MFSCLITLVGATHPFGQVKLFLPLAFQFFRFTTFYHTQYVLWPGPSKPIEKPFWHSWRFMGFSGEIHRVPEQKRFLFFPGTAAQTAWMCNVLVADQHSFIRCQRKTTVKSSVCCRGSGGVHCASSIERPTRVVDSDRKEPDYHI